MYLNELLIERRAKLSEDVNVYYNIEGIEASSTLEYNGYDRKQTFTDTIKKLLPIRQAA